MEVKSIRMINFRLNLGKYSKAPIIRTEHWAVLAVHSMYCWTGISTGTYNRNFRVSRVVTPRKLCKLYHNHNRDLTTPPQKKIHKRINKKTCYKLNFGPTKNIANHILTKKALQVVPQEKYWNPCFDPRKTANHALTSKTKM